jgi:hypothetical protein
METKLTNLLVSNNAEPLKLKMNYFKLRSFPLFIIALIVLSCEKDDICAESTATTPNLIVRFYDAVTLAETKTVPDLLVYGVNDLDQVVFFDNVFHSTTDSIVMPLRTDSNITRLVFHKDLDLSDFQTGNLDVISTNYTKNDVYVSRACGYKSIYEDLNATIESDTNNWIVNIEIINTTVENETAAHVKIFH